LTEDSFEIFHLLANLIAFELETDEAERRAREVAERLAEQSRELARLEERERIAMDLHDGVIQSLYGVALGLGAQQVQAEQTEADMGISQAIDGINRVIQEIRNNIFDLRLRDLGQVGLRGGIEVLAEELRINTLVRPDLDLAEDAEHFLGADAVTSLLYIARESTSNVIRHAQASTVAIRLASTGDELVLTIRDNGRGFDPEDRHQRAGDGLRNIRERARAIGGSVSIDSVPGRGTGVCVRVPRDASAGAA
jgi:two-component system, NarL family, sensor histidine kinase DevS